MKFTPKYYPLNAFRICADKMGDDVEGRVFSPLKAEAIHYIEEFRKVQYRLKRF